MQDRRAPPGRATPFAALLLSGSGLCDCRGHRRCRPVSKRFELTFAWTRWLFICSELCLDWRQTALRPILSHTQKRVVKNMIWVIRESAWLRSFSKPAEDRRERFRVKPSDRFRVCPQRGGGSAKLGRRRDPFMPAARQASCADPGADAAGTDVPTIIRPASSPSPWLAAESADPEAAQKSHFGDNPGKHISEIRL
jgi:hypothetical protein